MLASMYTSFIIKFGIINKIYIKNSTPTRQCLVGDIEKRLVAYRGLPELETLTGMRPN